MTVTVTVTGDDGDSDCDCGCDCEGALLLAAVPYMAAFESLDWVAKEKDRRKKR